MRHISLRRRAAPERAADSAAISLLGTRRRYHTRRSTGLAGRAGTDPLYPPGVRISPSDRIEGLTGWTPPSSASPQWFRATTRRPRSPRSSPTSSPPCPDIVVYVYDNCSTDATAERARQAGAIVRTENIKGKGNVVRRAFADIEADVYLMIDGDDTYDAAAAPRHDPDPAGRPVRPRARHPRAEADGRRSGLPRAVTRRGNSVLNGVVAKHLRRRTSSDMLSGYRVFSRRFVKSFPAISREFEIETELTVHCLAPARAARPRCRSVSATGPRAASPSCAPITTASRSCA